MSGTAVILVTAGGTNDAFFSGISQETTFSYFLGQFSKYLQVTASKDFTS